MRDLREEVVDDVRADVVVDLVEDAVVAVERREATTQVAPFLPSVRTRAREQWQLVSTVHGSLELQLRWTRCR